MQNVPVPAPPPPPLVFPPPPPPGITPPSPPAPPSPSGNNSYSTTITVQVFYNQVNGKIIQNACQSRTLYFVANVKPTYPGNSVSFFRSHQHTDPPIRPTQALVYWHAVLLNQGKLRLPACAVCSRVCLLFSARILVREICPMPTAFTAQHERWLLPALTER